MARAAARRRKADAGVELRRPATAGEFASAAEIFREYAASLDVDLCFQDFDRELASLPGEYAPPRGHLLLAYVRGELAGCGAMRPFADAEDAFTVLAVGETRRFAPRTSQLTSAPP